MPDYYAHSKEGRPPSEWRPLEEHLKNVAEMARGDLPIPSGQAIGAIWPGCGMILGAFRNITKKP